MHCRFSAVVNLYQPRDTATPKGDEGRRERSCILQRPDEAANHPVDVHHGALVIVVQASRLGALLRGEPWNVPCPRRFVRDAGLTTLPYTRPSRVWRRRRRNDRRMRRVYAAAMLYAWADAEGERRLSFLMVQ